MSSVGSPTSSYCSPTIEMPDERPLGPHRRAASTGGGRAWSDEEEAYLIETRMHKMPYKHIAAHLQKTELACRLHYHQLSFGTKRRRRTLSVSSMKSVYQSQQQSHPMPLRASASSLSPPNSPKSDSQHHSSRTSSVYEPITILPKPSGMCSQPPLRSHHQSLRLITQEVDHLKERTPIDPHRLNRIYDAYRCQFWAMIAQDYGGEVSPAMLEEAWVASLRNPLAYPLTPPNRSPQSEKTLPTPLTSALGITMDERMGQGFRPVNFARSSSASSAQRKSSFAISSILNEEEEAPRCSPVRE